MSSKLRISPELTLPTDVVTQKLAFLGRTGSGKTYAATKLAELMLSIEAQVVALDPVGKWYGLRVAGAGKGFDIPVLGGLFGDLPLVPTAGAEIADLIVDRGISAVLDVSQFETDAAKARFAEKFAERFFFRKKAAPSAVHVFLEECQEFVPQNPAGGEQDMLHFFTRLAKLGRNFGIGLSLISQRPQEVNKKVLNMTEGLFAFQMRGPQERKTIKEWSYDKDLSVDIAEQLPSLPRGTAFISSPQWLEVEQRIEIAEKQTADVSSTPTVGASAAPAKPLTPIDLAQLRETMAATIEKAKAEDPKELRREISKLKGELAKAGKSAPAKSGPPDPAMIEAHVKQGVANAMRAEWQRIREAVRKLADARRALAGAHAAVGKLPTLLDAGIAGVDIAIEDLKSEPAPAHALPPTRHASRVATPVARERGAGVRSSPPSTAVAHSNGKLTGARLKIVRGLAELEAIGVAEAKRAQLSFYCGLSFAGGYGSNTLGAMRTEGLLDYPTDGYVALTAAGRAAAGEIDPPASLDELHERVRRHLSGLEERVFEAVIALGKGGVISRDELGQEIGASFAGGYGSNTLGAMRTAGIIDYPDKGSVGPSDLLFPEGLS